MNNLDELKILASKIPKNIQNLDHIKTVNYKKTVLKAMSLKLGAKEADVIRLLDDLRYYHL